MTERRLTPGEVREARRVFGDRIDYGRPRIIRARHPLALRQHQVLAPDGNIYWPDAPQELADLNEVVTLATFIHEMAHVWQFQSGQGVLARGMVLHTLRFATCGRYDPYAYEYRPDKLIHRYNIEQQAEIAIGIYFGWYPNSIAPEVSPFRRDVADIS